jgi:hypothetical protein
MTTKKTSAKATASAKQKQIPFGNDNKQDKCKGNGKSEGSMQGMKRASEI